MPYAFHSDPKRKWDQQYQTTRKYILPFIAQHIPLASSATVLEIGCGEGGVLKAFSDQGYTCFGIDLSESRIEHGKRLLREEVARGQITLLTGDIHDAQKFPHLFGKMDLIILKDAIEHIPEQQKFLRALHRFLREAGAVFLAFPPWYNPFGGHQQLAASVLRFVPWFHLLPRPIYRGMLKLFGETDTQIAVLMEIYATRLSIRKFEKLLDLTDWQSQVRQFFLFNPGYEFKFGIRPRRQIGLVSRVSILRDFLSTAVYYLIKPRVSARNP